MASLTLLGPAFSFEVEKNNIPILDASLSVLTYSWLSIPAKKIVFLYLKIFKPIGEIVLTC